MKGYFVSALLTMANAVEFDGYSGYKPAGDKLLGFDYSDPLQSYIAREYDDFQPVPFTVGPIYVSPHDICDSSEQECPSSSEHEANPVIR